MKKFTKLSISIVIGLTTLQGCATKNYGRQGILSAYEKDQMTCREVSLEMAKIRGFIDQVNTESEFSGKDALAILGDLGIGNYMEKNAAIDSANNRLDALKELKNSKKCT